MRTIKFRGKDRKGEWQEGFLVVKLGINYILTPIFEQYRGAHVETDRKEEHEVSAKTIGQFTGLYDKNGKEIYEGDIMAIRTPISGLFDYRQVKYNDIKGAWTLKTKYTWSFLYELNNEYIVIGNIHDNPELMEGGTK